MIAKMGLFMFLGASLTLAAPIHQMNEVFSSLTEIIPYIVSKDEFLKKNNESKIKSNLSMIERAMTNSRHDQLIKNDLFSASYEIMASNLLEINSHFNKGNKEFSRWYLKEIMSLCIDCHTRIPESRHSSYEYAQMQFKENNFSTPFNKGTALLIVRKYVEAKDHLKRAIVDALILRKTESILRPLKLILLIELKVYKDPKKLKAYLSDLANQKNFPEEIKITISDWIKRLTLWEDQSFLKNGIKTEKEIKSFINKWLSPLRVPHAPSTFDEKYQVDLLLGSGIISEYFFKNPKSNFSAEFNFWLGWIEKRLKMEDYFSSGDQFLKQCIRKYSKSPVAKECFKEYQESVLFDFSGSGGTHIPNEIKNELFKLEQLIKKSGSKKN